MSIGNGISFEGATKPDSITVDGYEANVFAHRHIQIETNQQGMWEYDTNGNVIYAGYAPRSLGTSTGGWLLQKFTYSGSNITQRQIAYDSWDNRSTASYE